MSTEKKETPTTNHVRDLADITENAKVIEGVDVRSLAVGEMLVIKTKNSHYLLERREDGYYLSGNPKYCPAPTRVTINGSTWGGTSIKQDFIGAGLFLEFVNLETNERILTTRIREIRSVTMPKQTQ